MGINPKQRHLHPAREAFTPQDAYAINTESIKLGEAFVNAMNERMRKDTIKFSEAEVALANEKLRAAERELTAFRNAEAVLDPSQNSTIMPAFIAQLSAELNNAEIEMVQSTAESARNPRGTLIKSRIRRAEAADCRRAVTADLRRRVYFQQAFAI